jgi:hypothetical protein
MGIFSKIFRKDELELYDDKIVSDEDVVKQSKDEQNPNQNTEPSPFLTDAEADEARLNK